jgi:hypothetical protein
MVKDVKCEVTWGRRERERERDDGEERKRRGRGLRIATYNPSRADQSQVNIIV